VEVLATDLSTRALERAQTGAWPVERARQIPAEYLKAYMLRGVRSQEGWMRAGPELRRVVRFDQLNLNAVHWPALGAFDAIFCRNVMIYFAREVKEAVVRRLLGHLGPGGHFFLGHSESLAGVEAGARCVAPAVYTRQTDSKTQAPG
jgi:chemotaxis protein methyltransferase CheR